MCHHLAYQNVSEMQVLTGVESTHETHLTRLGSGAAGKEE
jgi:hypothetical protein